MTNEFDYCPHCGKKLVEEEKEEPKKDKKEKEILDNLQEMA